MTSKLKKSNYIIIGYFSTLTDLVGVNNRNFVFCGLAQKFLPYQKLCAVEKKKLAKQSRLMRPVKTENKSYFILFGRHQHLTCLVRPQSQNGSVSVDERKSVSLEANRRTRSPFSPLRNDAFAYSMSTKPTLHTFELQKSRTYLRSIFSITNVAFSMKLGFSWSHILITYLTKPNST